MMTVSVIFYIHGDFSLLIPNTTEGKYYICTTDGKAPNGRNITTGQVIANE